MNKDELWSKRTLARRELQDIEEALSLDDHYIDIIEQENAELQNKVDTLQGYLDHDIEYDMDKKLAQAKKYLEQALPYLENIDEEGDELYDKINEFIKE